MIIDGQCIIPAFPPTKEEEIEEYFRLLAGSFILGASLYITWCMKNLFSKTFFLVACVASDTGRMKHSSVAFALVLELSDALCVKIVKCRLRAGWRTRKNADSNFFRQPKSEPLSYRRAWEREKPTANPVEANDSGTHDIPLSPSRTPCMCFLIGRVHFGDMDELEMNSRRRRNEKIHEAENSPSAYTNIVVVAPFIIIAFVAIDNRALRDRARGETEKSC
jgi:hypothetical protein